MRGGRLWESSARIVVPLVAFVLHLAISLTLAPLLGPGILTTALLVVVVTALYWGIAGGIVAAIVTIVDSFAIHSTFLGGTVVGGDRPRARPHYDRRSDRPSTRSAA
jgi:hypothetical protein